MMKNMLYRPRLVWERVERRIVLPYHKVTLFIDLLKSTIELIALTSEINCNKTAMGLPPITSAVFLIAN
jgi:hypothetical protein